ncbi:MAG: xanthine dehydrogenase family protein subunit M [Firmicutes bacterium]|nr:xanthine dehydrogenase family protein subunit M [Bacillota bacterium]
MKYFAPQSLDEALEVLEKGKNNLKILAGGTDLIVLLKEKKIKTDGILDIGYISSLKYIKEEKGLIKIGSLATHSDVEESSLINEKAWVLKEAVSTIGSPQIRNRGTIAGNLAHSSPAGDSIPALVVLDSVLTLASVRGERIVAVDEFFTGPGKNVMEKDEIIKEIALKPLKKESIAFFSKLGQRKSLAISKVSVAFEASYIKGVLSEVRIALGAVAPSVIRAKRTERYLEGKKLGIEIIEEASQVIIEEASPIDDIRSSRDYRKKMTGALFYRGLYKYLNPANKNQPLK